MTRPRALRDHLAELTIDAACEHGLDDVSLRDIATRAGSSTSAIFQNFDGKSGLIAAAVKLAITDDAAFHDELRTQVFGLLGGSYLASADFIASYVELRAARPAARFLAEVLVKLREHPECQPAIATWHAARRAFWQEFVALREIGTQFAAVVGEFVVMEELYAHALVGHAQYRLLLLETSRALCDVPLNDGAVAPPGMTISQGLELAPMQMHGPDTPTSGQANPERMLEAAVGIIRRSGLGSLNQRGLAAKVGVSQSRIAYHFKDMRSFTTMAIWRALVEGIPPQFDPDGPAADFPATMAGWLQTLDALLVPAGESGDPGFYVSFARLTAEASLLARRHAELVPLIAYLRGLEGWGTYRVSRSIGAPAQRIRRDHAAAFGVWIKSEALLRNVGLVDTSDSLDRLVEAAGLIFPAAP